MGTLGLVIPVSGWACKLEQPSPKCLPRCSCPCWVFQEALKMLSFSFARGGLQKALGELTLSKRQVEGRPHRWDLLPHSPAVTGVCSSVVRVSGQVWWPLSMDPP